MKSHTDATPYSKDQTYFYSVPPGNYPATMRAVMNKRGNWTEVFYSLIPILRCNKMMQ
jgi:hypothetical protein